MTALFGRSGAGKTTIVNAVAGLLRPENGRIAIAGRVLFDSTENICLPPPQRRVGYVFQDARLFPHLSVRRNLTYGQSRHHPKDDLFDRVVAFLGLAQLLDRRPKGLSGGEKQRVAIGRALLSRPQLLLLDEPLAALDAPRKAEILPYLERIRDTADVPILYVSHAAPEVARLATTVVALHEGRVMRAGPAADILSDPAIVPALGVRQLGAVLSGRVLAHHPDGLSEMDHSGGRLLLPEVAAPLGSPLRIRVAAQDVVLAKTRPEGLSALNILPVTIMAIRQGEGPGMVVQLKAGDDRLLARVTRRSAQAMGLASGQKIFAVIKSVSIAHADVGRTQSDG